MSKFFFNRILWLTGGAVCLLPLSLAAQTTTQTVRRDNIAVPSINLTPDARSGSMGEAGVAISPDVNANYWNPSKLAFIEDVNTVSASYNPWLRKLVPDVSLSYLSYAHKFDDNNALGLSMRYFNLGSVQLTNEFQQDMGTYTPNEFTADASFARRFGKEFSLGLSLRYIHSGLFNNSFSTGQQISSVNTVAADVSMYYRKAGEQFGKTSLFAFGADISNIGPRVSYSDGGPKYFLPTNLRLGAANTIDLDDLNQFTLAFDLNKLLTPSPPIRDAQGNIISGKDDDKSVPAGIFGSFSDAPGGFKEELKEIGYSLGIEYWYNKQFALRTGYYYKDPQKGSGNYFTLGAGLKYKAFNLDFSYVAASQQKSPFANTLRFTLLVNFNSLFDKDE
ncbi:type IX secretion system outer membrane channel protein PorV [Mucilaginibacter sp. RS28]|uniref:Type IX secretion system outer membrane channel protein PorV n=1 Tax=Mucilaginibacter straminoryzae TaxID=2932774 RepID=A0A9X2BCB8_9SPHI|nr:type IX secretion system outer membrane channel protein PorV [Mucilaginibacter straminoryzae]MCJ8210752.1 type IX secretion system outer membrane channel protein PorV [Mucilaginibacter straminoryzae]